MTEVQKRAAMEVKDHIERSLENLNQDLNEDLKLMEIINSNSLN